MKASFHARNLIPCLAAVLCVWVGVAIAQEGQGKVPLEIWEKARSQGTVLVLVGLKVPWQLEGNLSQTEMIAQREAIAIVQRELLGELTGRHYKVTRQYQTIPGLALEVGLDALSVLDSSPRVINVVEDRPAKAPAGQTAPKKAP